MLKLPPPSDLKVYGCLSLVTLLALLITLSKIKMVEMITGPPGSSITFKPVRQRTGTNIKYTGNGFMPEDWHFFHSGVCSTQVCRQSISEALQGKLSDRAEKSLRILDTLRWTGPTAVTLPTTTATNNME